MQKLFWISGACMLGLACGKASEPGTDMNAATAGRDAEHASGHGSSDDEHEAGKGGSKASGDHPSAAGRGGNAASAGTRGDKPKGDAGGDPDAGCVEDAPAGMPAGMMMKGMMMKPPGGPGSIAGAGGTSMMGMDKPMKCRSKPGDRDPAMPKAGDAAPPAHDPMGHAPPPPAAGDHAPPPPPPAAGDHAPPPPPPAAGHPSMP